MTDTIFYPSQANCANSAKIDLGEELPNNESIVIGGGMDFSEKNIAFL